MLLHVNSLGYHEVYVNGKHVGDAVLTPAVSQFDKRSLIVTYDISELVRKGSNEIVLWLGKRLVPRRTSGCSGRWSVCPRPTGKQRRRRLDYGSGYGRFLAGS